MIKSRLSLFMMFCCSVVVPFAAADETQVHQVEVPPTNLDLAGVQDKLWSEGEAERGELMAQTADAILKSLNDSGAKYGPGKDQVNCTKFTAMMLTVMGINLTEEMYKTINMVGATPSEIASGADNTHGIEKALVDAGVGTKIEPKDAIAGDFIQVWKLESNKWVGHSGVVGTVNKSASGRVTATIISPSESASGKNGGAVTAGPDKWNLGAADTKEHHIYTVRATTRN